jgi:hypothetical protein
VLGELTGRPGPAERAAALLEGFDVAFTAAAILLLIGAAVVLVTVRRSDVVNIDTENAPVPGA